MTGAAQFERERATAIDCLRRGDPEAAALALCRAVLQRRGDVGAMQALCRLLRDHPEIFVPSSTVKPRSGLGLVSVVICSVDSDKFARVRESYSQAFGDAPWELIGIHDARCLAEGYLRGFRKARGQAIVFSHDDIQILSPDLGGALAGALSKVDVLGIVGTTKLLGPAHAWGGPEYARGRVVQPLRGAQGMDLVICNLTSGVTTGQEAIDGVFMAATRDTVEDIGFDEQTFDGFHLYDIDFSYRAHLAGRKVGVSTEIVLKHDSDGHFDETWKEYALRFLRKFPQLKGDRVANAVAVVPFSDAQSLLAYCARLDEVGKRALSP